MTVLKSYSTSVILFCRRYLGDHLKKTNGISDSGITEVLVVPATLVTSRRFTRFKKFNDTS